MKSIIDHMDKLLSEMELSAFLITDPFSLRYYTGFRGGEGTAVVTKTKKYLFVDSRYTEAAQKETEEKKTGFQVYEFNREKTLSMYFKDIFDCDSCVQVGFEDQSMSYHEFITYQKMIGSENILKPLNDKLLIPRQIKSKEELVLLKKAEEIGDAAFMKILDFIKPGITELEVAAELEYQMKKHGASGFSFDTIVASGIHSSMPHAIPDEKIIENGDFVTMDFGCLYKGYCSDMTRTIVVGKASCEQKKMYNIVLEAHLAAMEKIHAGMICKDVDKIARDYISNAGYGEYFGHGLGHSVGLYIHESPALNTRDTTVLSAGMIETIEPGIYIPGFGGVRIEDMGVVTEEGFETFAHSPKNLIEL